MPPGYNYAFMGANQNYQKPDNIFIQLQATFTEDGVPHQRNLLSQSVAISEPVGVQDGETEKVGDATKHNTFHIVPRIAGISTPEELQVKSGDTYYFSWFVYQGPKFMGIGLIFPTLCSHMYAIGTQHPTLHQAILAFSAHFAGMTSGKKRSDIHRRLSNLRPKLQRVLMSGKFNDGHIIAVFLVAALYHYGGNVKATATHLHGLSLMLDYDHQRRIKRKQSPIRSPIVSFVHRQCIRFFNQLSTVRQKPLQIQPTVCTKSWDVGWVPLFIEKTSVPVIEMTYTFQDFQFAVLHIYHRAANIRQSPSYVSIDELLISDEIIRLINQIKNFQAQLGILARGPTLWQCAPLKNTLDPFPGKGLPIVGLTEPAYGYLLLASYHLIISLTVIANLSIGPSSTERLEAASALCRHYAVLQVAPPECFDLPILTALFSAGITFSPLSHPDGTPYMN
jgi:hypothetical protein